MFGVRSWWKAAAEPLPYNSFYALRSRSRSSMAVSRFIVGTQALLLPAPDPRCEIKAQVDAFQHITLTTMETHGAGKRRRLRRRCRAFQNIIPVIASHNAAHQRSRSVLGFASTAQASIRSRLANARSTTVTMCHVTRTMPRVIEAGPNGVFGRLPFVRLGNTERNPTVACPIARAAQPTPAIANSTFILTLLLIGTIRCRMVHYTVPYGRARAESGPS